MNWYSHAKKAAKENDVSRHAANWATVNGFPSKMQNPRLADGSCEVVSNAYAEYLKQMGEKNVNRTAVLINGDEHHVVRHNGMYVDWTHRQYDPNAPVPLIEHENEYLKRTDQ